MKQSRIKRLYSKKLARQLARAGEAARRDIHTLAERESAETIAKMRAKGYKLATRLDGGEGVFVREDHAVGLHVQLPTALYKRLEAECKRRDISKKKAVVEALDTYLPPRS